MQRPSQRFRSVQFFIFEIFGRNDSPSYRTLYGDAGRFSFSQNFRNFPFGGKWNTSRRFVPLENSQKKWKILKGEPVFPVGISERNFVSNLQVSRIVIVCISSRSTVGHRDLPGLSLIHI